MPAVRSSPILFGLAALFQACASSGSPGLAEVRYDVERQRTTVSTEPIALTTAEDDELGTFRLVATCDGEGCLPSDKVHIVLQLHSLTLYHPILASVLMTDDWHIDLAVRRHEARPSSYGYSYSIEAETSLGLLMSLVAESAPRIQVLEQQGTILEQHKAMIRDFVDRTMEVKGQLSPRVAVHAR